MITDHHDTLEEIERCPVCRWIIDLETANAVAKVFDKISAILKRKPETK